MFATSAAPLRRSTSVRYAEIETMQWVWREAPCHWHNAVTLYFRDVPFLKLLPSGSWTDPVRVDYWLDRLRRGRRIPPPVCIITEQGAYYLRDGNHRFEALAAYFGPHAPLALVRIALAHPTVGHAFTRHRYGCASTGFYEAYTLQRVGVPALPRQWRYDRILAMPPTSASAAAAGASAAN
ncbi:MAG TPA: hypothetical protein VEG32_03275 [Clostridia bacterium]|nr:hypothetical protein [Clostridia bacterium]